MPDLKIIIDADVANAKKGIDSVTKALGETATAGKKVDTTLGKSATGINQAGNALTNLGRVAQDLPFGFVGIQNNLNPLLESFQRLKAETGSSRLALKALGSSLIGAGGIGFALSIASSAILLLTNGMAGFNSKAKEAKDKSKDFANALDEVRARGISTGLELQGFVNIAKDQTQSLEARNEALRQANKIMGEHGEKLTLLNVSTKEVTEQINKFTEATIQQALASKFSDRAADLVIAQRDASKAYGKQLDETNKKLKDYLDFQKLATAPGSGMEEALIGEATQLKKQQARLQESANSYKAVTSELGEMKNALSEAQTQAAKLFGELGRKGKPAKLDIAKAIKESKPEVEKALEHVFGKTIHIKTAAEILFDLQQAQKEADDKLGKVKMPPIKLNLDEGDVIRKAREIAKVVEDINLRMTESIKGTMNAAFASIGESIADSVGSGKDLFESIFGGLFKVIGAGIKQLGEAMIALGTAKVALEKFKFAPGIGTIIAGIAAVAIGALLERAIPGFADGVTNFGGGLAVVGERGPELVRLPKGSDVIPNHELGGLGGNTNVFIPDVRIRGNDLVLVFNRATAQIGRNG